MLQFNGQPVGTGRFPNQETYVEIPSLAGLKKEECQVITLKFEGNDDLIHLIFLTNHLKDLGFRTLALESPFFPYSTMDHIDPAQTRPLSLRYVADMINGLGFEYVAVWEAHSMVTQALIHRIRHRETTELVAKEAEQRLYLEGFSPSELVLVCPDQGAFKRYRDRFPGHRFVMMEKQRDFTTGNLTGETILVGGAEFLPEAKAAIILDDLCRAGGTFIQAGKLLRAHGVERIVLAVTHLENTAYDAMEAGKSSVLTAPEVDFIYATDSCYTRPLVDKLHIVSINGEET